MTAAEFAAGLREVAAFYEENPEMPVPQWRDFWVTTSSRVEFISAISTLTRGGKVSKFADREGSIQNAYHGKRNFGGVIIDVRVPRELVCKLVTPAQPAVYDCPDSLLADEAAEFTEVQP